MRFFQLLEAAEPFRVTAFSFVQPSNQSRRFLLPPRISHGVRHTRRRMRIELLSYGFQRRRTDILL